MQKKDKDHPIMTVSFCDNQNNEVYVTLDEKEGNQFVDIVSNGKLPIVLSKEDMKTIIRVLNFLGQEMQ